MQHNIKRNDFIRSINLFASMPADRPIRYMEKEYTKGEIITDSCEKINAVGIIVYGQVAVLSESMDGDVIALRSLYQQDVFGLCNLFEAAELPTCLKAMSATKILFIPKSAILTMLEEIPPMAMKFLAFYNQRILFLQKKIEVLNSTSSICRLCSCIINNLDPQNYFYFPQGKTALSKSVGISRASLYRALFALEEAEVIELLPTKLLVKDRNKILQYLTNHKTGDNNKLASQL